MSANEKTATGYKVPPAEHRFQKGQSGNPSGRPRKAKPTPKAPSGLQSGIETLAYAIAMRPVSIRDGDNSDTVPIVEAVLRAEAAQAARGKRLDKKDLLERHAKAEAAMHAEKRQTYDDWASIKAFKIEERETLPDHRWKLPLPHPDDIVLGPALAVEIIGPLNAAELANAQMSCRYRDLMILQSVLDLHWRAKAKAFPGRKDLLPVSLVLAIWIDRQIFRRFRLRPGELGRLMDRHLWKSRDELEDDIRAERQATGIDAGPVRPMRYLTIVQAQKILRVASGGKVR